MRKYSAYLWEFFINCLEASKSSGIMMVIEICKFGASAYCSGYLSPSVSSWQYRCTILLPKTVHETSQREVTSMQFYRSWGGGHDSMMMEGSENSDVLCSDRFIPHCFGKSTLRVKCICHQHSFLIWCTRLRGYFASFISTKSWLCSAVRWCCRQEINLWQAMVDHSPCLAWLDLWWNLIRAFSIG